MMPPTDNEILERLVNGLESTTKLAQALLQDVKESEKEFAAVKTELAILSDNFSKVSRILMDGNGEMSILTKIALLDQKIQMLSKTDDEINEVEKRLMFAEQFIEQLKQKEIEARKIIMDSVSKENELTHEEKKSLVKIKEDRTRTATQIVAAVVLAIITFVVTWFTKPH